MNFEVYEKASSDRSDSECTSDFEYSPKQIIARNRARSAVT
jgi:hypothetical protein